MHPLAACFYILDGINYLSALDDLAKYRIAPAIGSRVGEVEEIIICHIDKELCSGGVWIVGARHGDGVLIVFQAIIRLIFDGSPGLLLLQARFRTTALNQDLKITRLNSSHV